MSRIILRSFLASLGFTPAIAEIECSREMAAWKPVAKLVAAAKDWAALSPKGAPTADATTSARRTRTAIAFKPCLTPKRWNGSDARAATRKTETITTRPQRAARTDDPRLIGDTMYRTSTALALSLAALTPLAAEAAPVKFSVTIAQYSGPNTFLAMYLTDPSGAYKGTVWVAGDRTRYWRHLRTWYQATGGNDADGVTGASVGSGRTLHVTHDISAAMISAGYILHIDAAAEGIGESPDEIAIPLTAAGSGKDTKGNGFIANFKYQM
jgi:hypothetical protein